MHKDLKIFLFGLFLGLGLGALTQHPLVDASVGRGGDGGSMLAIGKFTSTPEPGSAGAGVGK